MSDDPFARFVALWQEARGKVGGQAADRAALATADAQGRPSVRYVLLRRHTDEGLVFFTNYASRKGDDLRAQPWGALALHWWETGVQLRAEGPVRRAAEHVSDEYWQGRPRGSRIGAWASRQSAPLDSTTSLRATVAELEARFEGVEVPRPEFWGGYELIPERLEIWFNRDDRLHERVRYEREGAGWRATELQP